MSRLPIYRDDLSFHDRNRMTFDDMRRRMESDIRSPFTSSWDDEFGRMCGDFYQLRPTDPITRLKHQGPEFGSREILDESTGKSVFVEDPLTKGRRFEMSFDVKEYDPKEISVKVQDDTLVVEAKHEKEKEGTKSSSQFSRKIQIPKEVDTSRLSSTLSNDGILTLTAPVPPQYNAVAPPPQPSSPQTSDTSTKYAGRAPKDTAEPKFVSSVYATPGGSHIFTEPSLMGRSSPIHQGRNSPMFTQRVHISPSQIVRPQTDAAPTPPQYDQCLNGAGTPVKVTQSRPTPRLEEPMYCTTEKGCELTLLVDIGKPYMPEDIKVKVDGLCITVDAEHVETSSSKTSKCSLSRDFNIKENIDPDTVTANLKGGILEINAMVKK